MSLSKKYQQGISLLTALMFSFIIFVLIAGSIYTFRLGGMSIESLSNSKKIDLYSKSYIQSFLDTHDFTNPYKLNSNYSETIDDYITNVKILSFKPIFFDGELYSSNTMFQYQARLVISDKNTNEQVTNEIFTFNTLGPISFKKYDNNVVPINVPAIDINNMDNTEKFKYLDDNLSLVDKEVGFVSALVKHLDSIYILGSDNLFIFPQQLSDSYQIELGWQLEKGMWTLYVALFDDKNLFLTSTSLINVITNPDIAIDDLNENLTHKLDLNEDNSTLRKMLKATWYDDPQKDDTKPELFVLTTTTDQNTNKLEYYNTEDNLFRLVMLDSMFSSEYKSKDVYLLVPSPEGTPSLDNKVLVFVGDTNTETFKNIFSVNSEDIVSIIDSYGEILTASGASDNYPPLILTTGKNASLIITQTDSGLAPFEYDPLIQKLKKVDRLPDQKFTINTKSVNSLIGLGKIFSFREKGDDENIIEYTNLSSSISLLSDDKKLTYPQIIYDRNQQQIYLTNKGLECYLDIELDGCDKKISLVNNLDISLGVLYSELM